MERKGFLHCVLLCTVLAILLLFGANVSDGVTTTEPDDTCASQPCENGGTCLRLREAYVCQCTIGFVGLRCETVESEQEPTACTAQPCVHGLCHSTNPSQYTCMCFLGWKGSNCNIDDNECAGDPCTSLQTCVNLIGSFDCRCPPGFTGDNCDEDICTTSPCENGGECKRAADTEHGYICQCLAGFGGHNCQASECHINICLNGGTCYQSNTSKLCECSLGYSGNFCETREYFSPCESQPCRNNSMCKEDKTEKAGYNCMSGCSSLPCKNGGSCLPAPDKPNGYMCECAIGFTSRLCEQKLQAVCYYNGESYLHKEVRITECNKCHCKYGSWLCTTKFCGTIQAMFNFEDEFSLITGRTSQFKRSLQLHLTQAVAIHTNVLQNLQISSGNSIHVEFTLVATADTELDIEEKAADVQLLLDSGSYLFPFEGHGFHVDITSVKLEKHELSYGTTDSQRPIITHTLLVIVCIVVSATLVLAVIGGLIAICVKRNRAEKTAAGQFLTTGISMNNTRIRHNNLENNLHNSMGISDQDEDDSDQDSEFNTKDINIYKTADFCY